MDGAVWERIVFRIALACCMAFFYAKRAMQDAEEEVPSDKARERTLRFRAAYDRMRAAAAGRTEPDGGASSGGAGNAGAVPGDR